jgi:flagellar assembly protein FliH
MQTINVNISPTKKTIRIIRSEKLIDDALEVYNNYMFLRSELLDTEISGLKEQLEVELVKEPKEKHVSEILEDETEISRKEKAPKTLFVQEFIITNENEPLEIDMSRVVEDQVPLSVAKEEIQNAYEKGQEDGQLMAMSTYKTEIEKYQEWIRKVDSVTDSLTKDQRESVKNFEESLVYLSVQIARQILRKEISADDSIVIKQIRKAIASISNEKIFKIHVHPDIVEMLETSKSELMDDRRFSDDIEIYPNTNVPIGGCMLETSAGLIDGRIENQLRNIEKALFSESEKMHETTEMQSEMDDFYNESNQEKTRTELSTQPSRPSPTPGDASEGDDFSYDDMPEEYKEMFGADIFDGQDMDSEGNMITELPEEIAEESTTAEEENEDPTRINYLKLLEEEEKLKKKIEEDRAKAFEEGNAQESKEVEEEPNEMGFGLGDTEENETGEIELPERQKDDWEPPTPRIDPNEFLDIEKPDGKENDEKNDKKNDKKNEE